MLFRLSARPEGPDAEAGRAAADQHVDNDTTHEQKQAVTANDAPAAADETTGKTEPPEPTEAAPSSGEAQRNGTNGTAPAAPDTAV